MTTLHVKCKNKTANIDVPDLTSLEEFEQHYGQRETLLLVTMGRDVAYTRKARTHLTHHSIEETISLIESGDWMPFKDGSTSEDEKLAKQLADMDPARRQNIAQRAGQLISEGDRMAAEEQADEAERLRDEGEQQRQAPLQDEDDDLDAEPEENPDDFPPFHEHDKTAGSGAATP